MKNKKGILSTDNEKDSFSKRHDQKIKCDVDTCSHNNCNDGSCSLPEINVSHSNEDDVANKDNTICDDFECSECDECSNDCCDDEEDEDK